MIIEHDILEQLVTDDWPLSRVVPFLRDAGANGWQIIARHVQEQTRSLVDSDGNPLPDCALWLHNSASSYPIGAFLVYNADGFRFGGTSLIAFTSSEISTGGRFVITGPSDLHPLVWGEGAFQEWLSGDMSF